MTVLFVFIPAFFNRFVRTLEPLLHFTDWPQRLLLTLVANLPWLFLTVLSVAVLLSFLRSSFHLELANLLGFEMAVLFFDREREDIGELLAVPVNIGFAHLNLDLSWNVVAILRRFPRADDTLRSITIVLGALVPLTVELDRIRTGHVVNDLLFHVTVRCLNICALIIVLSGHVDLVGSVANSILASETSLDLVGFFQGLIMDGLNQITDQLIHIEANSLYVSLNNPRTIVVKYRFTMFLILGPASSFGVGFALVLKYHFLNHMAVGILVDAIPTNISLTNVRIILLSRCWSWIFRWRWKSKDRSRSKQQKVKCSDHDFSTT